MTDLVADGDGIVATTAAGRRIRAQRCVVATSVWGKTLGVRSRAARKSTLVHATMLATSRLSDPELDFVGSDRTACVASLSAALSCRRLHEGRLLYGGLDQSGGTPDDATRPANVARLTRSARRELPFLADVAMDVAWSGPIYSTTSDLPGIEASTELPRTAIITGSAGSGAAWALLAGGLTQAIVAPPEQGDAEGERLRQAIAQTRTPYLRLAQLAIRSAWRALRRALAG